MAQENVLDDRQAETGTAGVTRTAAVDAVKALGQAWQVFGGDTDTGIANRKDAHPVAHRPFDAISPPAGV
jgi:hypothetical protein